MNLGAATSNGEILLFLHADTRMPEGFTDYLDPCLKNHRVVAGAFRLGLEPPVKGSAFIEKMANWRAEKMHLPYGDQAIFVPARRLKELGGYKEIPLLEDVELVRRLRRIGRLAVIPIPVAVSSRRWKKLGSLEDHLDQPIDSGRIFFGVPSSYISPLVLSDQRLTGPKDRPLGNGPGPR